MMGFSESLRRVWPMETSNGSEDVSDGLYETIGTRFERRAAATPDNLAVVTDELSLTYGELDAVASRIAGGLAVLPSSSDRPVALLMPEGPSLYYQRGSATQRPGVCSVAFVGGCCCSCSPLAPSRG